MNFKLFGKDHFSGKHKVWTFFGPSQLVSPSFLPKASTDLPVVSVSQAAHLESIRKDLKARIEARARRAFRIRSAAVLGAEALTAILLGIFSGEKSSLISRKVKVLVENPT